MQLSNQVLNVPRVVSHIAYDSEQEGDTQLLLLVYEDHNPNRRMAASKKHLYDQETLDDH